MALPPNIRFNVNMPFPALVQGSGPVQLTKANGIWTIALNLVALGSQIPLLATLPTNLLLVYDTINGTFFSVKQSILVPVVASYVLDATDTTSFVATAAQTAGTNFVTLDLAGTLGAGANITTPSAIDLLAAVPNGFVGQSYRLRIRNTSSANFAWTLVGGTGVTITGTATIAQNKYRDFVVTFTGPTTVTIQNIGGGDV